MFAIEIENLTLSYQQRVIIENFSANIMAGEFIGIFGPNGSGKSTLLRAILGLLVPQRGSIKILQQVVQRGSSIIGYMPQFVYLGTAGKLNGMARLHANIHGEKWGLPFISKKQKQRIQHLLKLVNAEEYAARPYNELSGGERQRLALAQALIHHPKILLLDEPLTNLDLPHQDTLIRLIQTIQQEEQVTVLFTAHDLNPLLGVMDRLIYLARGKGMIGTVDEIVTQEKLSQLYDMEIDVINHNQRIYVVTKEMGGMSLDGSHHHDH